MKAEMSKFSRTFVLKHYIDAIHVYDALKEDGYTGPPPKVDTWELYNKAFTFPRIR